MPRSSRYILTGLPALALMSLLRTCVAARDSRAFNGAGRSLLLTSCPATCQTCNPEGTAGGRKCLLCVNSLIVLRSSNASVDGDCGCPAGTFVQGSGAEADCLPCPINMWCPGGTLAASTARACPANMCTLSASSKRLSACVNNPGYKYVPGTSTARPLAVLCPSNTYSPGLKWQNKCRACPSGFKTHPDAANTVRTTVSACYAPPGYFVNSAGSAAACPKGEYKAGYNTLPACARCRTGVTTAGPGKASAADCNTLRPGFQGVMTSKADGIISTSLCPRGEVCPGLTLMTATETAVDQGSIACENGLQTQSPGSISAESSCQVPPGFTIGDDGMVQPCGDGTYREGWVLPDSGNITCLSCGVGVPSDPDAVPLVFYADDGSLIESIPARTSSESCYIDAGWGVYKLADGSFMARACNGSREYGAPATLYGLIAAPCRQCPLDLVVGAMPGTPSANADAFVGALAISPDACVTQAGYGYEGRGADICAKASYAPGSTRDPCTDCPDGKTTAAEGATSIDDCTWMPGLDATGMPCPIGTFSTGSGNCQSCPVAGRSTETSGATSADACSVCAPGYAPVQAGTCRPCGDGFWSAGGMDTSTAMACNACPTTTFTLDGPAISFEDMSMTLPATTAPGARSSSSCVAALGQLVLTAAGPIRVADEALTTVPDATTASACADACRRAAMCQFVNILYNADGSITCRLKLSSAEGPNGDGWTLFGTKQINAGDVGAESLKEAARKSVGSGSFTFWADPHILDALLSGVTATSITDANACQDECTMLLDCAGIILDFSSASPSTPVCKHVKPPAAADGSADSNTRTLLNAIVSRSDATALIAGLRS